MNRSLRSLIPLTLLLLIPIQLLAQKDDDIISVDSSIVVMNAAVTDASGKAVAGINPKLFHVFEDGVEQEITSFQAEETPFAAVILLDTSGSMEERVSLARSAAIQFLGGLRVDDYAAIYNFDSKVELVQDFSNTRDLREQIFDLKANGMTVLNDAIFKASEILSKRPEKRRAIIVLSDGADTMSKHSEDKALKAAMSVNATIYTVDMSSPEMKPQDRAVGQGALKNYASKSGGTFVTTPAGAGARDAFRRIVEELGGQYTLTYEPKSTKKDGKWRALELRISRPNLNIRTRKGYNAPRQNRER